MFINNKLTIRSTW